MLLYLLALICPPLGILVHGKIFHALLNGLIWGYALMTFDLIGTVMWMVASAHASYVIHHARMIRSLDSEISF